MSALMKITNQDQLSSITSDLVSYTTDQLCVLLDSSTVHRIQPTTESMHCFNIIALEVYSRLFNLDGYRYTHYLKNNGLHELTESIVLHKMLGEKSFRVTTNSINKFPTGEKLLLNHLERMYTSGYTFKMNKGNPMFEIAFPTAQKVLDLGYNRLLPIIELLEVGDAIDLRHLTPDTLDNFLYEDTSNYKSTVFQWYAIPLLLRDEGELIRNLGIDDDTLRQYIIETMYTLPSKLIKQLYTHRAWFHVIPNKEHLPFLNEFSKALSVRLKK